MDVILCPCADVNSIQLVAPRDCDSYAGLDWAVWSAHLERAIHLQVVEAQF